MKVVKGGAASNGTARLELTTYVDGVLQGSATPVFSNGTLDGVSLDARHDGDNSESVVAAAWAVDFDELRVYATEISTAHIKALASGVGVGASAEGERCACAASADGAERPNGRNANTRARARAS